MVIVLQSLTLSHRRRFAFLHRRRFAFLFGAVLFVAVRFAFVVFERGRNCVSAGVKPRIKREPKFDAFYNIPQTVIHVSKEDTIFVAKSVAFKKLKIL